jgi:hypothetical protein
MIGQNGINEVEGTREQGGSRVGAGWEQMKTGWEQGGVGRDIVGTVWDMVGTVWDMVGTWLGHTWKGAGYY